MSNFVEKRRKLDFSEYAVKKAKESVTFSTYFLAFFETMAILSKFEQNSYLILPFRVASDEKNWLFPVLTEKKPIFMVRPAAGEVQFRIRLQRSLPLAVSSRLIHRGAFAHTRPQNGRNPPAYFPEALRQIFELAICGGSLA